MLSPSTYNRTGYQPHGDDVKMNPMLQPEPAMASATMRLSSATSMLDEALAILAERLLPVRNPIPVGRTEDPKTNGCSPLVLRINENAARIEALHNMVRDLTCELEI